MADDIHQMLDDIEAFWKRTDEAMKDQLKRQPDDEVQCFTCPNKEPGCCYQKNIGPFYEALPISRFLRSSGRDTPELRARLRELGDRMEAADREDWFQKDREPCVFLEGGRCSIYKVRPMACRSYFVVSDPAACQPGRFDGVLAIDSNKMHEINLSLAKEAHRQLKLKETPKRILMGVLPRMVLLGLEVWDSDDYPQLIRSQIWPSDDSLRGWADGDNPFRERLYQIGKAPQKE